METSRAEHQRLEKKGNLKKAVDDVQKTIDLLVAARDAVSADPTAASMTSVKLKNPVKQSFDKVKDDMQEVYSAQIRYTKALDKKFKSLNLPTANSDPLTTHPNLTNRAIAMHLLREGQFNVASTFIAEANAKPTQSNSAGVDDLSASSGPSASSGQDTTMEDKTWSQDFAGLTSDVDAMSDGASGLEKSTELQEKFAEMYHILHALRKEQDSGPAISWAREHSEALELRGSNLEFELCRLRFVELYSGWSDPDSMQDSQDPQGFSGPLRALQYAREVFPHFSNRYSRETSTLLGSLAFFPSSDSSPYKQTFFNDAAWEDVASSFVREFCGLLGLSEKSPSYTAVTAGGIALPVLEKSERKMGEVGGQWTSVNESPVEIPLPPSYLFHSIFVCPVSKEQATDVNPPMMMPCGHIIAKESLEKVSRGNKRFKCPYCPNESHPREAKQVYM